MAEFYEGQRVRVEAGKLKSTSRFLRSIDGKLGTVDFYDGDEVYLVLDDEVPVFNPYTGEYYVTNFVDTPCEAVKPLIGEVNDHIFGLLEDII
jgi:hypothetical protein